MTDKHEGADMQRYEQEKCEDPPDPEPTCDRHPSVCLFREDCGSCGGEGWTEYGELHDEDPLWYDEEDTKPCGACMARGWFYECSACMRGDTPQQAVSAANAAEPPQKAVEVPTLPPPSDSKG